MKMRHLFKCLGIVLLVLSVSSTNAGQKSVTYVSDDQQHVEGGKKGASVILTLTEYKPGIYTVAGTLYSSNKQLASPIKGAYYKRKNELRATAYHPKLPHKLKVDGTFKDTGSNERDLFIVIRDPITAQVYFSNDLHIPNAAKATGAKPEEKPRAEAPTSKVEEEKSCNKSFMLKGKGPNGDYKEVKLTVKHRFNDYSPDSIPVVIEKDWKVRYSKSDFHLVADPSWKYNCAGYVFDRLWHKGKYWFMADVFYDTIIKNFGKQISSVVGFGSAQMDDVVVWFNNGVPSHIAIVNGLDNGKIFIGTKDAQEGVYAGTLSTNKENPLYNCGTPWIYRIDPAGVTVEEINPGECDDSPVKSTTGWIPEIVIDPGKVQGTTVQNFTIDSISLDKINISTPNGWKFSIAISGLPKVINDEIEFELTVDGTAAAQVKDDTLLRISFGLTAFKTDMKPGESFDLGKIGITEYMKNKAVYKFKLPPEATRAGLSVSIYGGQGIVDLYYWNWRKK